MSRIFIKSTSIYITKGIFSKQVARKVEPWQNREVCYIKNLERLIAREPIKLKKKSPVALFTYMLSYLLL
jgi:hypothetical protein